MNLSVSRCLTLATVVFVSQPAFAHSAYHHAYRHTIIHHRYAHQHAPAYAATAQNFSGASAFGQGWSQNWIQSRGQSSSYDGMVAAQASANGVPASLIERVIKRESGGNARAMSRGNYGLMQIRLGTARAMGYNGSAEGLLDPATNMTYAVRYLAGAYRAAGGNESRAVALYASGYGARSVQRPQPSYQTAVLTSPVTLLWNSYQPSYGGGRRVVYRVSHHHRHSI
jgi:soluble lytic murein transglycosylase-like protein